MGFKIHLSASEAQYEAQDGKPAPIPSHQPNAVVIGLFKDDWVQLTYNTLRSAPNGDEIAHYNGDGFWVPTQDFPIESGTFRWCEVPPDVLKGLQVSRMKFSDVTIEYIKEA